MRSAAGIALFFLLCTGAASAGAARPGLRLTSPSYRNGGAIPTRYTCVGKDVSPPLAWSGAPGATRSFVLFFYDRDAADAVNPKLPWVHWLLYNIPRTVHGLAENASESLPTDARRGENSWKRSGYGGPCPPTGVHHYVFMLYALDTALRDLHAPGIQALEAAMHGHILARARLTGVYEKPRRSR